jgi:Tol biopolymer transport system component
MTLAPGTRLGPYQISDPLGAGGMGEVYRAKDTRLGREVAVKILPEHLSANAEARERFEREAKAISSLNHPNICTLYDVGEHEGIGYLVMELLEGETLSSRLERGAMKVEEALRVAVQVADALDKAHRKGIVHRDLKPGNIVLSKNVAKILDFGVAKLREEAASPSATGVAGGLFPTAAPTRTTPLTSSGAVLGTMQYMAPEQLEGKPVDHRADLFSFGAVLYEMVTGKRAFEGESRASVIAAILDREPRPISELSPVAPRALDRVVGTCLAKDPDDRWQSAADLGRELRWIAGGEEPAAAGPESGATAHPGRGGVKTWSAIAVVVAVVVVGALALGELLGRRSANLEPPAFRELTFQSGFIHSARFEPDGKTVVYGSAQAGKPVTLFSTRTDSSESRPLDLPGADVVGMSRDGRMALLLGRHHTGSWIRIGTLAEVSLTGGTPREILENVFDADIAPDGRQFAAVTGDANEQRLEFPIGKVLFHTPGWISQPRIAPDGMRVAFVEHPFYGDDRGYVALAGADGKATRLSGEQDFAQGLCWSPSGEEIWFTVSDAGRGGVLATVAPGKAARVRLRVPVWLRVQDVSSSGEILVTSDVARADLAGRLAGDGHDRNYSWWRNDVIGGIASDGTIFAGNTADAQVNGEYTPFFRRNDGRPPVRLGEGIGSGITPDGRWVVSGTLHRDRSRLTLYPTGPGQPRVLDLAGIEAEVSGNYRVTFSSDGRRLVFVGVKPGSGYRAWVLDLSGGAPRPVSPEGVSHVVISPDGTLVAVRIEGKGILVCPVDGGEPKPLPGAVVGEVPVAWSASGREVLVWDQTFPAKVSKIDRDSGHREPVREIEPEDPAGILYGSLVMTTDGRYYIYRYRRVLNDLFVLQGLR